MLTKEQRDEHIRRYAELLKARLAAERIVTQNAEQLPPRPVGRPKSVITEIAEATGLKRDVVSRAITPPAPKPVKSDHDVIIAQANAIFSEPSPIKSHLS